MCLFDKNYSQIGKFKVEHIKGMHQRAIIHTRNDL